MGHISQNSSIQSTSGIYREQDTNSVGTDTFGDRLTAITVETNGTLADDHVESITLKANNTTIANTTHPNPNGTWVLEPDPEAAWFGPGDAATTFSLHATVASDAPGGATLALEVPPVNDSDGDGAYDPGDTGIFLAQDAPRGGFGPGGSLTVQQTTADTDEPETPSPVALSLEVPETNRSASADSIPVQVVGNDSERAIDATLEYVDNDSVAQSWSGELNSTGDAAFAFEAVPGRYRVRVTAVETNDSVQSEPITVEPNATVSLASRTAAVQRGDRALFDVDLAHTDAATLHLEGPDGEVLESVTLEVGSQSPPYEIAIDTDARGVELSGPGYRLEPTNTTPEQGWISAVGTTENGAPSTEPGPPTATGPKAAQPAGGANRTGNGTANRTATAKSPDANGSETLAAGSYTLVISGPETQRASATVRVTANWSATIETFVAPRDVSLANPGDIRAHASERDEVAVGDRLVIAVDTSGLDGYTDTISTGGPPSHANNSKAADRTKSATATAGDGGKHNGPPAFVSVGPAGEAASEAQNVPGLKRIDSAAQDQFYVVAEAAGEPIRPGTRLESAVVLTEETPFVSAATENGSAETSGTDSLDVIEARARLHGVSENGSLDLPIAESVSINGTTTVAPGTTATVQVDGANDSVDAEWNVTVAEDGTYETTANLSDYESGTEYTVSVTADGEQLSSVRSGQFLDTRSGTDAASSGGGGGGGGWLSGSSESEEGKSGQSGTTTAHETTTGPADSIPNQVRELPAEAAQRAWSAIPEPLRIGPTELLLIALGSLALLTVGRGIVRLLRP